MATKLNPLEAMTIEFAEAYKDMVMRLTKHFAPERPWWHAQLSPDEQVWRWMEIREEVLPWLMTAGAFMGWKDGDEVLKRMAEIFTDEGAVDKIPPEHVIQVPVPLMEMVQNQGPRETAAYIRKVEKMTEGRAAALGLLDVNRTVDIPEPPFAPPPLPTEMMPGTGGWPLYGNAPRDSQNLSAFGG